ncbi:MAG: hypothetical protein GY754_04260 [bacterium]|nr:hypothetical protein [bacterium]
MSSQQNERTITLEETQRETLELILKEIILNLPQDRTSPEEVYRLDAEDRFKLCLYGDEMR